MILSKDEFVALETALASVGRVVSSPVLIHCPHFLFLFGVQLWPHQEWIPVDVTNGLAVLQLALVGRPSQLMLFVPNRQKAVEARVLSTHGTSLCLLERLNNFVQLQTRSNLTQVGCNSYISAQNRWCQYYRHVTRALTCALYQHSCLIHAGCKVSNGRMRRHTSTLGGCKSAPILEAAITPLHMHLCEDSIDRTLRTHFLAIYLHFWWLSLSADLKVNIPGRLSTKWAVVKFWFFFCISLLFSFEGWDLLERIIMQWFWRRIRQRNNSGRDSCVKQFKDKSETSKTAWKVNISLLAMLEVSPALPPDCLLLNLGVSCQRQRPIKRSLHCQACTLFICFRCNFVGSISSSSSNSNSWAPHESSIHGL